MVNATRGHGEPAAERVLTTLLVSSDPEVLETLRRALSSPSITYVGEAWPGIDAARRAAATQPDVVVLHVEDPLVPALRTVQAIAEACPAGIAVISSLTDIETVRRVMNAGAHDFATLPLTDDQLQDAVIRAARTVERRRSGSLAQGPASSSASGTVITVAGPRGGVGKTLIAANLAIEIARLTGTAVAVADLDLAFGGIAAALDVLPQTGLREWLSEHAARPNAPLARHLTDHHSGLRVLAAPQEPQLGVPFEPSDVADLVADLSGTHEYVILDTACVVLRRDSSGDRPGAAHARGELARPAGAARRSLPGGHAAHLGHPGRAPAARPESSDRDPEGLTRGGQGGRRTTCRVGAAFRPQRAPRAGCRRPRQRLQAGV